MSTTKIAWGLIGIIGLVACGSEGTGGTAKTTDTTGADGAGAGSPEAEGGETPDGADPAKPTQAVVEGIAITGVAVFQGVKVDVVKGGAWVAKRNAPVVAGRPAVVRVYVTPDAGWTSRAITGELRLVGSGAALPVQKVTKTIAAASKDETPGSTLDFEVPADAIAADTTFQVALTSPDAVLVEGESDARFPKDGSMRELDAKPVGKLRVVIVPVKYDADGSGRLPDVSAKQLERYKNIFASRYPTSEVEVTARAPLAWTTPITRNGSGFSQVLRAITQLRQQDRVASDVYYYGALAPAATFSQFCNSGCVLGLSSVVEDASTSLLRASVGIGYGNAESASTMAHEIGHAHGREHAPCGGAQGVDPSFPYSGGSIGVWGYDIVGKEFISPTRGKDMMGYCSNEWVSDYTYSALFDRIAAISKPPASPSGGGTGTPSGAAATYHLATVEADGTISTKADDLVTLDEAPSGGELREVEGGGAVTHARFFRFDHLPGGFVLLPTHVGPTTMTTLRLR